MVGSCLEGYVTEFEQQAGKCFENPDSAFQQRSLVLQRLELKYRRIPCLLLHKLIYYELRS